MDRNDREKRTLGKRKKTIQRRISTAKYRQSTKSFATTHFAFNDVFCFDSKQRILVDDRVSHRRRKSIVIIGGTHRYQNEIINGIR